MRVALSKEFLRKEKLLQLLLTDTRIQTAQEIADELKLSKKTVSSYIQDLNVWLENWGLVIESSPKGYMLVVPAYISVHELVLNWVKEDIGFQFCTELFFEQIESIETFIEKLYITSAQFYKNTAKVKNWIESANVSFETKPSVRLKGEENQIRYAFFQFFWESFKGSEWPFPFSKRVIEELVLHCSHSIGIPVNNLKKEKISYAVAVCLVRAQQGNFVEKESIENKVLEDKMFSIVEEGYKLQLEKIGVPSELYQTESLFLVRLVSIISVSLIEESPSFVFQQTSAPILKKLTDLVVEELEMTETIKPEERRLFIKRLTYLHMEVYSFDPIMRDRHIATKGTPRFQTEKERIRKNIVQCLIERLKIKGIQEGISIFSTYTTFLAESYEYLIDKVIDWAFYFKPIQFQMQTDSCVYMSEQISTHIKWLFPEQVEVVPQNYNGDVDIIITTSNINQVNKESVLVWDTNPSCRDWKNLTSFVDMKFVYKDFKCCS